MTHATKEQPTMLAEETGLPGARKWWAMSTLIVGGAVATLDTAIANTALPTIAADLHASPDLSVWIINAYQLAMVAALLPLAALGDRIGHRRIYFFGLGLFTLASLASGFAWSLSTLVIARILQGVGAAGILGVGSALLRLIFPPHQMGRAQGLNALTVAVFFAVGPTVTSIILSISTWPWLFLINVPLGLVAMTLAIRTLPYNHAAAAPRRPFDVIAAGLLATMLSLVIFGLGELSHHAPPARVAIEFGVAALCCALLLRRERADPAPLLPVDLFRLPLFSLSMATSSLSYAAQGLAFVALPFLMQTKLGRTAVETGLLFTPWPILSAVTAPLAGYLSEKRSVALLCGTGLVIMGVGLASTALLPANAGVLDIAWRLAICGAGFGFFQSPNLKALSLSAPKARIGSASGLIPAARLFGQALGAALVAACFSLGVEHGSVVALWLASGFAAVASMVSVLRLRAPAISHA
ncbi:MFS transporter (plasmid) [Burkholderia sp. FERM BP-3421]|jgi:DHA2 family multidrug resistance protein-like MFS transporter|uniref:MFS transporter n=1 Tax=Burkholderia sp. FERM BP-3421 TaxID=1494466 RepID=UPI002362E9F3|nr:MFS transporter [Burkholderia sp. FERM BP-3421]WDD90669.1 MFS transporter [Burkholderia sp. FERM BP-3421]